MELSSFGWAPGFGPRVFAGVLMFVCFVVLILAAPQMLAPHDLARRARLRLGLMLLVPFCVAFVSFRMSNAAQRSFAFEWATVFTYTPKYWAPAARHLDDPEKPVRVAVTSGPNAAADGWFIYPFFGHELTNHIAYIPVTDDDDIVAAVPGFGRNLRAIFNTWLGRLSAADIDYVMAFWPTKLEVEWMRARPGRFERIEGDDASWGLYRIREK